MDRFGQDIPVLLLLLLASVLSANGWEQKRCPGCPGGEADPIKANGRERDWSWKTAAVAQCQRRFWKVFGFSIGMVVVFSFFPGYVAREPP